MKKAELKMKKGETMKTRLKLAAVLLLLSTLNPCLSTAFAQGSLTPPGPPAPTMLTLSQVEPRTPISFAPMVITNPGSYYLVSNLNLTVNSNAIIIAASDVTLDLRGFTIGTSVLRGTGAGILLNGGNTDVSIYNGHITGGVFSYLGSGITYSGPSPNNVHVASVSVAGCQSAGINLGTNGTTLVEGCTVQSVSGYGIQAGEVSFSTAYQCGQTAIIATTLAVNSTGNSYYGDGIDAAAANGCYGAAIAGTGIGISTTTANSCYGYSTNGFAGIVSWTANNCYGYGVAADGIFSDIANNCVCQGSSGTGLASIVAIGCYCSGGGSGVGLDGSIAESCYANTQIGVTYKLNMP
jgi:hypothetical protein